MGKPNNSNDELFDKLFKKIKRCRTITNKKTGDVVDIPPTAKIIYAHMRPMYMFHHSAGRDYYESYESIADEIAIGRQPVARLMKVLVKSGLVEYVSKRDKSGHLRNIYTVHSPDVDFLIFDCGNQKQPVEQLTETTQPVALPTHQEERNGPIMRPPVDDIDYSLEYGNIINNADNDQSDYFDEVADKEDFLRELFTPVSHNAAFEQITKPMPERQQQCVSLMDDDDCPF
ncbi:DUF6945 domain-containing protein [Sodalis sp. RH20]|uniref:DUF6945 domain-containing protein n=1 Tax=unclassified Sodalis (in: enterobacteria) TaxID=2636512 RepID=UPI0039B57F0C